MSVPSGGKRFPARHNVAEVPRVAGDQGDPGGPAALVIS
jgi:hypothetical protein